jgi:CBS domain-containing protein
LFEYRPRSLIPVSLAAATASGVRIAFVGSAPVLPMPDIVSPSGGALATYIVLGAAMGVVAIIVTRGLYGIEDAFEHLPIHWMWWPALGAIVVGVVGYVAPRTLGVGYENIEQIIGGSIAGNALLMLVVFKLISWIVALGSGTSGGTLAPLFTIGGGVGALVGGLLAQAFPSLGIDPRIGALVGMAAIFAGASHAVLASVVFAFEVTRQPLGLLPLLAGCSAAYLVSLIGMRHSIMTEKLARRGTRIRSEYAADYLDQILVRDIASDEVVTLAAEEHVEEVRDRIAARVPGSLHQGFPVINDVGDLVGVVTRRDLLDLDTEVTARVGELVRRSAVVIFDDNTAREAADHMVHERVGRLPVVSRANPRRVIGIVSRSDLLEAHERRLHARHRAERTIDLGSSLSWVRPTER